MSALMNMIKVETKLFLRDPTTLTFGVLFPTTLLLGLGSIPALRESSPDTGGLRAIDIWAPTALVFGMVLIAVQHVPAVIATYRERGILRRLSTTPVHPRNVLVAQMIVAFASVLVSAALMVLAAWAVLGIAPPERPLEFLLAFIVGYAAVLGVSMVPVALVRTSGAATQIGTLLFVGLMFFGGAFLPRVLMPDLLREVGEFIPPGLQALTAAWPVEAGEISATVGGPPFWLQIAMMAGIAVVASAIAAKLFRWEEVTMMRDARDGDSPDSRTPGSDIAEEAQAVNRSRLAWKAEQLRVWDLLQLVTPWVLLTISTAIYFSWALPRSGDPFWPAGASVLALVTVAALWMLFGQTLPLRRGTLRPVSAAIYFVGLLALCLALMSLSDIFVILTVAGFFHAYLLSPWPVGVLGVLATSVALNGSAMRVWSDPNAQVLTEFVLIVAVQTAAIGVGIVLTARSRPEERKREQLVERLEAALHENAGLHAQLVTQARESGAQDERQRLAREIHDTLAQGVAGIITQLQAAQRSPVVQGEAEEHVERALRLARSSLSEARRSVRALAPEELGRAHLPEALRTLTEGWSTDHGTSAHLEVTGTRVPLSPAIEVSLFRVVQESLTNVAKHADASRVGVTLSYAGSEVLLDVRDDGRGFADEDGTGFGLTSMRQRIRGVGGHVEVQSPPGEGTSVSARVPAIAPGSTRVTEGSGQ